MSGGCWAPGDPDAFWGVAKIDWALLARSEEFYASKGYEPIQAPFAVPLEDAALTKPHGDESFMLFGGMFGQAPFELVGSAEQSFIWGMRAGKIRPGQKLCAATPCFRSEQEYGPGRAPWFMKLELFAWQGEESWRELMSDAGEWFRALGASPRMEQTGPESADWLVGGQEAGSYGMRQCAAGRFAYGTGIALPRFSLALQSQRDL